MAPPINEAHGELEKAIYWLVVSTHLKNMIVKLDSGQIIIFHQPGFSWNKGTSLTKPPFGENRSCEVAIIWPDWIMKPQGSGWKFQKYLSCHHRGVLPGFGGWNPGFRPGRLGFTLGKMRGITIPPLRILLAMLPSFFFYGLIKMVVLHGSE